MIRWYAKIDFDFDSGYDTATQERLEDHGSSRRPTLDTNGLMTMTMGISVMMMIMMIEMQSTQQGLLRLAACASGTVRLQPRLQKR